MARLALLWGSRFVARRNRELLPLRLPWCELCEDEGLEDPIDIFVGVLSFVDLPLVDVEMALLIVRFRRGVSDASCRLVDTRCKPC